LPSVPSARIGDAIATHAGKMWFIVVHIGVALAKPIIGTMPIDLTKEQLKTAIVSGLVIRLPIDLGNKTGWLRIVIRDSTGAVGSLRIPLGN
jgi:hypothetical protein